MMKRLILAMVTLTQIVLAQDKTKVGIERIHTMFDYNNIIRSPQNWHLGWFGYNIDKGSYYRCHSSRGLEIENSSQRHGGHDPRTLDPKHVISKLDEDIKFALIDKERFDHAIASCEYLKAYQFAHDNPQGQLWKEVALMEAKKSIETYAMRGILRDNSRLKMKAADIVASFTGTDPYADLLAHYNQIVAEAQADLDRLFVNPVVAALHPHLQKTFATQLFGEL